VNVVVIITVALPTVTGVSHALADPRFFESPKYTARRVYVPGVLMGENADGEITPLLTATVEVWTGVPVHRVPGYSE
jgi:hypothetical protein